MSLVSAVIADIRVEVHDEENTRFATDTVTILPLVRQAIRRANRICQRNQLHFAKKSTTLTTIANQNYVAQPSDLDIPIGIWRDDLHQKLTQVSESDWEQIVSAGAVDNWIYDVQNSRIMFNATPTSEMSLTMWYFPTVDPTYYTVNSDMPWGGRLDDIIARYVALRLQNIEEANVTFDQSILAEMEQSIVSVYAPQSPLMIPRQGWM